jgi:hypothetical protein
LYDRCSCFDSGDFFYFEIDLFREASSERSDLEISFSRDVINRGIEGFDGGVYGHLDADKDSHPEGDPYDGKKGPSFMVSKMAKRDFFEKVWENHKLKIQMSKFLPALRLRQAGK